MLIYSPRITPRLRYTCEEVFSTWHLEWTLTTDLAYFKEYEGIRINYSEEFIEGNCISILPEGLLNENTIHPISIEWTKWGNLPVYFPNRGEIPFDIFSAIFFLLSRYEEYWPFEGDKMGRFKAENSICYQANILDRPIVDEWRKALRQVYLDHWPHCSLGHSGFKSISTIDVDSAFAYKHKGLVRTAGGALKDVFRIKFQNLFHRTITLGGLKSDAYETYHLIRIIAEETGVEVRYFFLLSDFGPYDKNVPHTSRALRELISELDDRFIVGIHPGVASNGNSELLGKEKERLEEILGKKVVHSRQHYLILHFPITYRTLIDNGIKNDYSMGYSSQVGFRAGTSLPFDWYDLEKEEITSLRIHPFAVMDATLCNYLHLSPAAAIEKTKLLIDRVKEVQGSFMSLWHNESLSETEPWIGYSEVYHETMRYLKK